MALLHAAVPPWAGSFQHVPDVTSSHWVEGERVGKTSLFRDCLGLEVTHSTSVSTALLSWSHDPVGRKAWKSGVWASKQKLGSDVVLWKGGRDSLVCSLSATELEEHESMW